MLWVVGPINRRVISDSDGAWVCTCANEENAVEIAALHNNFEAKHDPLGLFGGGAVANNGTPNGTGWANKTPEQILADVNEALSKCADASKALDWAFDLKPVIVKTPKGWVNHL